MAEAHGYCDPKFEKVRELLFQNVSSGAELGASICINIKGKTVLDLWGGFTDENHNHAWEENTIVNVWSITKTITALAALVAIDRGVLDINEKVSTYWPEFAQNGKQDIQVRHLLSHRSGVSGWDRPISLVDVYDLEKSTAKLAAQAPWFEPGTVSGYHSMNMGHLVGELIRRTTGKSLGRFIEEEIAAPLGADFQLGAAEKDWPRTSDLIPPPMDLEAFAALDKSSVPYRTFMGPAPDPLAALTPEWRRAEIGAVNGHGNARSITRILSAISLGGEVDGVRLLSQNTIDLIFQEQCNGTDLVLGVPVRLGIGYGLPSKQTVAFIPDGRKCFWGGWGGSVAVMDLDHGMTVTYMMNKMSGGTLGNECAAQYFEAIYEAMGDGL